MINKSKPLVADPAEVPTYGHRYVFLGREWLLDHSYEKYIQIDDNPSPAMRHTRQLLSFHNFATESLHLRLGTYQWIAKRQLISVPFCKGKTTAQEMLQPYYNPISHMPKEGQQVFLFDKLWMTGAVLANSGVLVKEATTVEESVGSWLSWSFQTLDGSEWMVLRERTIRVATALQDDDLKSPVAICD